MRPEFDRQIDSLLRDHARRADGRPAGREVGAAAHLDADELSAFAENSLPARARARHTAHLAECGECRKLVSQITLSSGVAEEIERREGARAVGLAASPASRSSSSPSALAASPASAQTPAPGWRERFASLFGAGAWRYAMPLAALLVVSAAVLLLMSGRRNADLGELAAHRDAAQTSQSPELNHAAQNAQGNAAGQGTQSAATTNSAGATSEAEAVKSAPELAGPASSDALARQPAEFGTSAPVGGPQRAEQQAEAAKSDAADAAAPPPVAEATPLPTTTLPAAAAAPQMRPRPMIVEITPTPTPAPPAGERKVSDSSDSSERDRYEERMAAQARGKQRGHGPMRSESRQQQLGTLNRQADGAAQDEGAAKSSPARGGGLSASRRARGEGEQAKGEQARREDDAGRGGETRSVGGRRFRRQGDAWVDTAYRPAQATVNVGRGSEQYRSLVGDEPGIGRIAAALGGEVVVVWKGRAYRIK